MTTATLAEPPRAVTPGPRRAPKVALVRLLRTEFRWVLRRPRTIIALVLLGLVPIVLGIGIKVAAANDVGPGGSLIEQTVGNGLVLPLAALSLALALLLPLTVTMAAADALAGESAAGTLRGLLVAPVSRLRLVLVKAAGVLAIASIAVALIAVIGLLTGFVLIGDGAADGGLLTVSGTTIGVGEAIARVAFAAVWVVVQLAAVAAIAMAVSSVTEHPLVVLAVTLGGLIVFTVLSSIPALSWLQPVLLTTGWTAIVDVLRDPLPLDGLWTATLRALCYIVLGGGVTVARMLTRDA